VGNLTKGKLANKKRGKSNNCLPVKETRNGKKNGAKVESWGTRGGSWGKRGGDGKHHTRKKPRKTGQGLIQKGLVKKSHP